MTSPRNPLLEVGEWEVGASHVPAFRVYSDEVVGFVVRRGTHEKWTSFFRDLLRDDLTSGASPPGSGAILDPLETYRDARDGRLPDILISRGLTGDQASEIISTVGVHADRTYSGLQLTERVLIELHVFLQRGVNLAVVATAGLDPPGIHRLVNEAVRIRRQCSSLVMCHADFLQFHEPLERFTRIIQVP
jgi:hypothetical protein